MQDEQEHSQIVGYKQSSQRKKTNVAFASRSDNWMRIQDGELFVVVAHDDFLADAAGFVGGNGSLNLVQTLRQKGCLVEGRHNYRN